MRDKTTRSERGIERASSLLEQLTGRRVIGGNVERDSSDRATNVRFDFDGNVSDVDMSEIAEYTGRPTEARGWSIFVKRQ